MSKFGFQRGSKKYKRTIKYFFFLYGLQPVLAKSFLGVITTLAKSQNSFKKQCVRAEHRTRIPRTAPFKVLICCKDLINFLMAMILFEKERKGTCKVPHFRNLLKERCVSCVATETLTKCKAPPHTYNYKYSTS